MPITAPEKINVATKYMPVLESLFLRSSTPVRIQFLSEYISCQNTFCLVIPRPC